MSRIILQGYGPVSVGGVVVPPIPSPAQTTSFLFHGGNAVIDCGLGSQPGPELDDPDPALTDCGTDLLERGAGWLSDQLQAHFSKSIIYQRGHRKIALCATLGRKLFQIDDGEGGIRMEWTDADFIVPAASLVISGETVLPERGDRITLTQAGKTNVYEVRAPGGETPWQWSDPYRKKLRIHGKLIRET